MDIGVFNKAYLYLNCGKKSIVFQKKFTLSEKIDIKTLKSALKNIIGRFHYFRLKPVIDESGSVDFVGNDAEPEVYEFDDEVHHLGTEEVNGYLFRISVRNCDLYISIAHAIADGRGALLFCRSLIYEYLRISGKKLDVCDEVLTNEAPASETEKDTLTAEIAELSEEFCPEEPFIMPSDHHYFKTEYQRKTVLSWSAESFSDLVRRLECTPAALITAITGKAIYKNFDVKDKKVLVSIPVDLRPFYNSRAQSNFFVGIKIEYKREYADLPLREQLRNIQEAIEKQLDISNLKSSIFLTEQFFKNIAGKKLKTKEEAENASREAEEIMKRPEATFMLSNLGIIKIPEQMKSWITDFECTTSNTTLSPLFTMMTIGAVGKLVITQNDDSKVLLREIADAFLENGVEVQIRECGRIRMDNVVPFEFLRLSRVRK